MKTNVELCVDLKTHLQNDVLMKPGKKYPGVLQRDVPNEEFGPDDGHYSFIETVPPAAPKRNPRVYSCELFTLTLRDDGRLRMNVKPIEAGLDFSIDGFALRMSDEIRRALPGLVGEGYGE